MRVSSSLPLRCLAQTEVGHRRTGEETEREKRPTSLISTAAVWCELASLRSVMYGERSVRRTRHPGSFSLPAAT